MSGLEQLLGGALSGDMMAKIAGQLNTDEAGAQKAVGAALPALLGRLKANADDPQQADALAAAVNRDHDGSFLDSMGDKFGGLFGGSDLSGSKIVGKVFGADADAAQEQIASEAGIDKGQAAGLLGALAPMVMGALGKSGQATGGVQAQGLSGMLGGLLGGGGGAGGGLGGMLGGLLGGGAGGGLGSMLSGGAGGSSPLGKVTGMLDQNKDGSVIDDITRMATGGGSGTASGGGMLSKLMGMLRRK